MGLQALRACELFGAGHAFDEVLDRLAAYRREMNTLVLLSTLENIVRGGRLRRFEGSLSKVVDIMVLLHDVDGEVAVLARMHGKARLLERALDTVRRLRPDLSDRDVGISHFNNPDAVEWLKRALTDQCHPRGFVVSEMGSSLATYAGEGGVIVAF